MIGCILIMFMIIFFIGCDKYNKPKELYKSLQNKIKKGEISSTVNIENCVYGIEKGNLYVDDNIVIACNKDKKGYRYKTSGVVNDMCIDNESIYYINTLYKGRNISVITRIPRENKDKAKITSLEVKDIVLGHITTYKDKIYAYGFNYNDEGVYSKMYVYKKRGFKLLREIDFSDYIIDVMKSDFYNNMMYVTGRSARKLDKGEYVEIPNHYVCEVDLDNYDMRKIYSKYITRDIICSEQGIYVTNYDEVLDEGNKVMFLLYEKGYTGEVAFSEKVRSREFIEKARKRLTK